MYKSKIDIQSAAAEIRRGKEKEEEEKEEKEEEKEKELECGQCPT